MWSPILLCLLLGLTYGRPASDNPGWRDNSEYIYQVRGRTLTSLNQLSDDYAGILFKAQMRVRPRPDGNLDAQIYEAEYTQIHSELPEGWDSYIPGSQLAYRSLPLAGKPFQVVLNNGAVRDLIVSKEISNWEANMIKSIVSQFQLDTEAKGLIPSHINVLTQEGYNNAVYKTMEETVTGVSETLYEIHPLPEHLLQTEPWLVPLRNLKRQDGEFIEIVKTKNFTHSDERPSYHFGLQGIYGFETSNKMANFLTRSSVSRAVITGTVKRYTIQSSITIEEISVRPTLTSRQRGSVNTLLNVTLVSVEEQSSRFDEVSDSVHVGLVYKYNRPYSNSNEPRPGKPYEHQTAHGSAESDTIDIYQQADEGMKAKRVKNFMPMFEFSSESFSSSQEEDYYQEYPKLNEAPESPLLPYTVGFDGQSFKKVNNVVEKARKLAQRIGEEFQHPQEIPAQNTVGKFVILTSLLRIMDEREMQEVAGQLYAKERHGARVAAWKTYRDAVAQSGTGPALITIKNWIEYDKISGIEAAQVVATAANSARQPTEDYMKTFFEMIQNDQIMSQKHLNESVLLSYTKLVHEVYVNKQDSHNKYPVHSFGYFRTTAGVKLVENEIIPHLTQKLHRVVADADTEKIHVYIRALGNVGHQGILEAFEKYLEGEKQASHFQRTLMVIALDQLVRSYPKVARSVLYKIYQNPSENEEVRVAAVYQLMRTNPSPAMLQRMASYTNLDPNHYVNAAVKSVIESASQLQGKQFDQLRLSAQSAKPLLTSEQYGIQYSYNKLHSYVVEQMNLAYKQNIHLCGSEDSLLPKGIKYYLERRYGGVTQEFVAVQAMISSLEDLVTVFQQQTQKYQEQQSQKQAERSVQHKWSSEYIAKLLDMENEQREQLEGNLYLRLGALQKIFSFDNQTIENLPQVIRKLEYELKNGQHYDYSKMVIGEEIAIAFPTALGLPFIYTYEKPIFVQLDTQVKASVTPQVSLGDYLRVPDTVEAEFEVKAFVSGRSQSQLGFITPFDHMRYSAGYDKNFQVIVPLAGTVQLDVQNSQINFEIQTLVNQYENLLHFSTYPYTAKNDVYEPQPEKQVIRKQRQYVINKTIGQKLTGIPVKLEVTSDQVIDFGFIYNKFHQHDLVSLLLSPWVDENIQHTEVNVGIDVAKSHTNKLTVQLGYQHKMELHRSRKPSDSEALTDIRKFDEITDEPLMRQMEFMKRVVADVSSPTVHVIDATVIFKGRKEIKYTGTVATAKSNIDPKARFLAKFKKHDNQGQPLKVYLSAKSHVPNTNGLNMEYAMELDPTSTVHVKAFIGESYENSAKVNAHVKFSKSEERIKYLRQQPAYRECKRQMEEGNHQLPVCAKMTARANLLDQISVNIEYENLNNQVLNGTYHLYSLLRHYLYPRIEEDVLQNSESEAQRVDIQGQFAPDLKSLNVSIDSSYGRVQVRNVQLNDWARELLVPHPVFHVRSRLVGRVLEYDTYRPICVVDKRAASTFDNKSYPLSLTNDWTILWQYVPRRPSPSGQSEQSVLEQLKEHVESYIVYGRTSGQSSSEKDIKMVIQTPKTQGKVVEILLKPSGNRQYPRLIINNEEIVYNNQESPNFYDGYMQVYNLPNNEIKVQLYQAFYVIYDGVRAKFTVVNDKFRDASRGLCGTFTGEPETDFVAPNNCILQDPEEFAASYTVLEGRPENRRNPKLQNRDDEDQCYQKKVQAANYISAIDAGKMDKQMLSASTRSCTRLQTRYIEQGGETCFTLRPLPVCKSGCQQKGNVSKKVPVHCVISTSATDLWKNEIKKGASPDFSLKSQTKTIKMVVPQKCLASV